MLNIISKGPSIKDVGYGKRMGSKIAVRVGDKNCRHGVKKVSKTKKN